MSPLDSTEAHCTIELSASPGPEMVFLNWNAYVGWDTVLTYEIYRVTGYEETGGTLIGSVEGNITSFVDTSIGCDTFLCYRVSAIGNVTGSLYSWSDTACTRLDDIALSTPEEMIHATVEDNQDVRVAWLPTLVEAAEFVNLERNSGGGWSLMGAFPPSTVSYLDTTTDVSSTSYHYRISVEDSCAHATPWSRISTSILLQITHTEISAELSWSAYLDWAIGVERYEIELRDPSTGSWSTIATVGGTETTFLDDISVRGTGELCYRVRAFETGGNLSFSLSNEACIIPEIEIPNTFTPNGDGFNDTFRIISLEHYPDNILRLYNRWGDEIYSKEGYVNDWDGTNAKNGKKLPDGVYYYILELNLSKKKFVGYVMIYR